MSFQEDLAGRSAAVYADFLAPHLGGASRLLDLGCGAGTIAVGLAAAVRSVVALDLDASSLRPAAAHVREAHLANVAFVAGDGSRLPFADESFDAVLLHSVLEAAADPPALVREARRVLVRGGVLAAASVEYGGRILAGPHPERLDRFYAVRERLWTLDLHARPRAGRDLRALLDAAGFSAIEATAKLLSYGTPDAVRAFGEARARDCTEAWFAEGSVAHGLYTEEELRETERAWKEWAQSPEAFFAFAWCRAVGRKGARSAARA